MITQRNTEGGKNHRFYIQQSYTEHRSMKYFFLQQLIYFIFLSKYTNYWGFSLKINYLKLCNT